MHGRLAFLFGILITISMPLLAPDAAHAQGKWDGEWVGMIVDDNPVSGCAREIKLYAVTVKNNKLRMQIKDSVETITIESILDSTGNYSKWHPMAFHRFGGAKIDTAPFKFSGQFTENTFEGDFYTNYGGVGGLVCSATILMARKGTAEGAEFLAGRNPFAPEPEPEPAPEPEVAFKDKSAEEQVAELKARLDTLSKQSQSGKGNLKLLKGYWESEGNCEPYSGWGRANVDGIGNYEGNVEGGGENYYIEITITEDGKLTGSGSAQNTFMELAGEVVDWQKGIVIGTMSVGGEGYCDGTWTAKKVNQ